MENDTPRKMPNVPPFVKFVCANVPMVFDDSLSYYEALCALWKYVQECVDVINNNATLEEEYMQKFDELKEFVDNYFDNLDVQEEINNKLDAMVEDGTFATIIANVLGDPLNVKLYGVKGDGITDDTSAIQDIIDNNPNRTLYFPNGVYLISSPIVIKSGNDEQVNLNLDSNATIKTNTAISSIIEVGKTGNTHSRDEAGAIVEISGGILDATNASCAIYICARRQNTYVHNMQIINVAGIGIDVEKEVGGTNRKSADANITDMLIGGTGSAGSSVGITLNAYDNKLSNIRINNCTVGVDEMGGSFMDNIHCMAGFPNSSINKVNFEKTVGFRFRGNGIAKLNQCYADTFGKAYQFNTNMTVYIQNSMAYWYLTDSTYDSRCMQLNNSDSNFRLYLDNFECTMPTLGDGGHNVVLDLLPLDSGIRNNIGASSRFHFSNIRVAQRSRLTYKDDYIFCRAFYGDRDITINEPNAVTMETNKYYPIAKLGGTSYYDIRLDMGTDQSINLKFYNDNSSTMTVTNLVNNAHANAFTVAVCNMTWDFGCRRSFLCIKSSSSGCNLNPKISGANGWNNQIFTYNQFNENVPLDNPTVVSEESFNP